LASLFKVLLTFMTGGGLSATASIDFMPPTQSSPGYGVCERMSRREFRAHIVAFARGEAGRNNGLVHVHETVTVNEADDTYAGTGSFQVVATTGQVLFGDAFSVEAKRIRAQ
jgi:hypothetical protein